MLKLDGNSEYAFATKNSINANPIVFVEWNYNSIARPYVVAPNSYGKIEDSNILLSTSAWASSAGTAHKSRYSGYSTHSNPSPSAIVLTLSGTNNSTFRSDSVPLTSSSVAKYYKMTFYAKSDQPINSYPPKTILASDISVETSAVGTNTYLYRIVQADKNGNTSAIDYDYLDVKDLYSSISADNIKLHWDHEDYAGPAYQIYRGTDIGDIKYFLINLIHILLLNLLYQ
jgi:hypothetical protein